MQAETKDARRLLLACHANFWGQSLGPLFDPFCLRQPLAVQRLVSPGTWLMFRYITRGLLVTSRAHPGHVVITYWRFCMVTKTTTLQHNIHRRSFASTIVRKIFSGEHHAAYKCHQAFLRCRSKQWTGAVYKNKLSNIVRERSSQRLARGRCVMICRRRPLALYPLSQES